MSSTTREVSERKTKSNNGETNKLMCGGKLGVGIRNLITSVSIDENEPRNIIFQRAASLCCSLLVPFDIHKAYSMLASLPSATLAQLGVRGARDGVYYLAGHGRCMLWLFRSPHASCCCRRCWAHLTNAE